MGETSIVQELIHSRKRLPSLVEFHQSLRRFGMKAKSLIDDTKYKVPEQFVAAAIVSYSEIENANTGLIDKAEEILFLKYESKNKSVEVLDFYLLFDRLIMLFNLAKPLVIHGDARLFDHDGKIMQKTSSTLASLKIQDRKYSQNFLRTLKQQFYKSFSKEEKYVILIFSHFIPCTAGNHNCSRLLYEFARRKREQLIISYFAVHRYTNPTLAWDYMRHNPFIYCIHPRDVKFGPKPFPPPKIQEKIDSQFEEDEYFRSIKPHFFQIKKKVVIGI